MTHYEADEGAPIACSMELSEMGGRMRQFHEVFAASLRSMSHEPRRLRLVLDGAEGLEPRVADLLEREHACCAFADITLQAEPGALIIEIGVPQGAERVLDGFAFIAETAAPGAASAPQNRAAP